MRALTPELLALAARLGRILPADDRRAESSTVVRSGALGGIVPATSAPGERSETTSSAAELGSSGSDLARLLAMPLDRFAREGQLQEVRIPWLDVTLWFVPAERDAEALGREGVSRGRIWTARELIALMALPDRTPEIVQSLALAKQAVGGDIVEVRRQ